MLHRNIQVNIALYLHLNSYLLRFLAKARSEFNLMFTTATSSASALFLEY